MVMFFDLFLIEIFVFFVMVMLIVGVVKGVIGFVMFLIMIFGMGIVLELCYVVVGIILLIVLLNLM